MISVARRHQVIRMLSRESDHLLLTYRSPQQNPLPDSLFTKTELDVFRKWGVDYAYLHRAAAKLGKLPQETRPNVTRAFEEMHRLAMAAQTEEDISEVLERLKNLQEEIAKYNER